MESVSAFKKPAGLTTGFCRTHSKGPGHSHHETHLLYVERFTKLYLWHILNPCLCRLMMVKVSGQWQHGRIHSSRSPQLLEMLRLRTPTVFFLIPPHTALNHGCALVFPTYTPVIKFGLNSRHNKRWTVVPFDKSRTSTIS